MGWVTLALRKSSLKQEHSYYQLRLLQISREKRQMARRKSYETNSILAEQRQAEAALKQSGYIAARTTKNNAYDEFNNAYDAYKSSVPAGTPVQSYTDWESSSGFTSSQGYRSKAEAQQIYDDAVLDYQDELNSLKTDYETDLQMLEEEAADEELVLDQEQVEVETQMEAISQELQAVSEAVSSQIQSSTIKLA